MRKNTDARNAAARNTDARNDAVKDIENARAADMRKNTEARNAEVPFASSRLDLTALNREQRQAVECTCGPLLVLAGAGSGKTRVLTHRIAYMIESGDVEPWQILAITFTNKAAAEMRERLEGLLGRDCRGMWVCTFHAMCVRMLRRDADLVGYRSNFTIYDDDDSRRLIRNIMSDFDIDTKRFPLNMVRSRISAAKNALITPVDMSDAAGDPSTYACARVYEELERRLLKANAMDFDDLLVNALKLLNSNEQVLRSYQERFTRISVDEYQDTNDVQYRLTNLLAQKHRNLMVVGDDDQSIYSWRGANIKNILNFEKDYPDARVVKLEQNYRSTGHILEAANAVVAHNSRRKPKHLFTAAGDGERVKVYQAADERDEGRWIAGEIERLHTEGTAYDDIAVFFRTNAQSRVLEDMFLRAGVPYKIVGGTHFFDRAEIRDVTAYLKVVLNPNDDVSCERIINTPRRGIGSTSIKRLHAWASEHGCSLFEAAQFCVAEDALLGARVRRGLGEFCAAIEEGRRFDGDLATVVEAIVDKAALIAALEEEHTLEADTRIENIREFLSVAAEFDETHDDADDPLEVSLAGSAVADTAVGSVDVSLTAGSNGAADVALDDTTAASLEGSPEDGPACNKLPAFMEWLALRTDLDGLDGSSSAVTMMTIHSAKGLEFPVVFVAGMEEGLFPHVFSTGDATEVKRQASRKSGRHAEYEVGHHAGREPDAPSRISSGTDLAKLEEERRLAYVAITRAEKILYLVHADKRRMYGSSQACACSRFIREIPQEHLNLVGRGSAELSGTGWEKRGDRRATFGSGRGQDMYGGSLFGQSSRTVSSRSSSALPHTASSWGSSTTSKRTSPHAATSTSGGMSPAQQTRQTSIKPDATRAHQSFAAGDRISHKTFGPGVVVAVDGDVVEVVFSRSGSKKRLLKGFAPIVKIDS